MEEAKIQFSPAEIELMCDAGVLLTKNRILFGIRRLLEVLEARQQQEAYLADPGDLGPALRPMPKISKGENYLGLPYLVLDFPRQFDSRNIFAVRTMFWWGNAFSSTLHLAGDYKDDHLEAIVAAYPQLKKRGYFIGISEDPWQHHFGEENYRPVFEFTEDEFAEQCTMYDHLKIATEFPLRDVHFVGEDLMASWRFLLGICGMEFRDPEGF
ncbi:hypothetical protein [Flaviaesturariibacter amylovorans]|uniref:hypothetical protein n=1 Tax=Flaviaesturariibacter amylovorans TaxID=1084520 RepID=UPI0031E8E187